ncbi:hypothetical protein KVT40_009264 [Elsinoe batatas]|uniref:Uncharacterized protein n=1 Tax=Elsinoe batatas TaxID=2601811 RepID=A0A8K0KSZ2_9PEZI|nr:hypothetical protein KVT40_009264 [Elsinoe batatas]
MTIISQSILRCPNAASAFSDSNARCGLRSPVDRPSRFSCDKGHTASATWLAHFHTRHGYVVSLKQTAGCSVATNVGQGSTAIAPATLPLTRSSINEIEHIYFNCAPMTKHASQEIIKKQQITALLRTLIHHLREEKPITVKELNSKIDKDLGVTLDLISTLHSSGNISREDRRRAQPLWTSTTSTAVDHSRNY